MHAWALHPPIAPRWCGWVLAWGASRLMLMVPFWKLVCMHLQSSLVPDCVRIISEVNLIQNRNRLKACMPGGELQRKVASHECVWRGFRSKCRLATGMLCWNLQDVWSQNTWGMHQWLFQGYIQVPMVGIWILCSSKNVSELYTSVMTGSGGEFGDACQNILIIKNGISSQVALEIQTQWPGLGVDSEFCQLQIEVPFPQSWISFLLPEAVFSQSLQAIHPSVIHVLVKSVQFSHHIKPF